MLGCEIILSNTFHLMLRPGAENIAERGGLHKWIGWDGPILTDSGGFQVFSLSDKLGNRPHGLIKSITDEGVTFQSPIDGSTHALSPERSIQIQEQLGADIIMAFDECSPGQAEKSTVKSAMERTHQWALRSLQAKKRKDQALFPIVQGGIFEDLRTTSAKFISQLDAPGFAIGGVAVGESKEHVQSIVQFTAPLLPKDRPRYLMGIGEPDDLVAAVAAGCDMFDCVIPTRLARHGNFFREDGSRASVTKSEFAKSDAPLAESCKCYTCSKFTVSYLRHLMVEGEILGHRLLTIHNLHFLLDLMRKIRHHIEANTYEKFSHKFLLRTRDAQKN